MAQEHGLQKRLEPHESIQLFHAQRIQQGFSVAQRFNKLSTQKIGDNTIHIYRAGGGARPHPWSALFEEEIPGLEIKYPNLAAFILIDNEYYAISTGSGYTLFESFIDTSFPLDAARHIMKPELSATTERDIAGAVYGRIQQFRTSQLVVSSQNLGTVWQAIKGEITDETRGDREFLEIYDLDAKKITVSAGSSLKIHKSLEVSKLVNLLKWVNKLSEKKLSDEQREAFSFLDGLREVSPRKNAPLIENIKQNMGEQLLASVKGGQSINFDYSHRRFTEYQGAKEYRFGNNKALKAVWDQYPPTATEVFAEIHKEGITNGCEPDEFVEQLSKINFIAEHEIDTDTIQDSVLNHLHGEVQCLGKTYFLIDSKFYAADDSFVDRVGDDFRKLLESHHFQPDKKLKLSKYLETHKNEGGYNESYIEIDNWLVGDRVFHKNVEIADIFHWDDEQLYIIHNKQGYNVTVRDVCSQILHSMSIMNQMKASSDRAALGEYYDKIIKKYYSAGTLPITKSDFIEKILKTEPSAITYVMGYINQAPVTTATQSNIAKFESVKLCMTDRRAFDFKLKVMHIAHGRPF